MRQLNMWHRVGIVLSVLWVIGGGYWQRESDVDRAAREMAFTYKICTDLKENQNNLGFSKCEAEAEKSWIIWLEGSWASVAVIAIVPIPFAWLLVYCTIWTVKWVMARRRI